MIHIPIAKALTFIPAIWNEGKDIIKRRRRFTQKEILEIVKALSETQSKECSFESSGGTKIVIKK